MEDQGPRSEAGEDRPRNGDEVLEHVSRSRFAGRRQLGAGALVCAAVAALGLPLGLLWWAIAPRAEVTVVRAGEYAPYPVSQAMFASEGYFVVIAAAAGLLCGHGAYLVQYRLARGGTQDLRMACLLGTAFGGAAASLLLWGVGAGLDASAFRQALEAAQPGEAVEAGLRLQALAALVVWPFVGVLQYGLLDAVSIVRRDLPHQHTEPPRAEPEPVPAAERAGHGSP